MATYKILQGVPLGDLTSAKASAASIKFNSHVIFGQRVVKQGEDAFFTFSPEQSMPGHNANVRMEYKNEDGLSTHEVGVVKMEGDDRTIEVADPVEQVDDPELVNAEEDDFDPDAPL